MHVTQQRRRPAVRGCGVGCAFCRCTRVRTHCWRAALPFRNVASLTATPCIVPKLACCCCAGGGASPFSAAQSAVACSLSLTADASWSSDASFPSSPTLPSFSAGRSIQPSPFSALGRVADLTTSWTPPLAADARELRARRGRGAGGANSCTSSQRPCAIAVVVNKLLIGCHLTDHDEGGNFSGCAGLLAGLCAPMTSCCHTQAQAHVLPCTSPTPDAMIPSRGSPTGGCRIQERPRGATASPTDETRCNVCQ